jgi:ribonuclease Z
MKNKSRLLPGAGLTLVGHSRAAEATYFYLPELRAALDLGGVDRRYRGSAFYFLSHSHADHASHLPVIQPSFQPEGSPPRTLFVPREIVPFVRRYLHSAQELNRAETLSEEELARERPYTLLGVSPGEEYTLHPDEEGHSTYRVQIFRCYHTVPAVGYGLSEVRRHLKPALAGLPAEELRARRERGEELKEDLEIAKLAFLGDTTAEVFRAQPELFRYPVIICECTFLYEAHRALAEDARHTHWSELEGYVLAHPAVSFVLIHFSLRYRDEEIEAFFDALPGGRPPNLILWLDEP